MFAFLSYLSYSASIYFSKYPTNEKAIFDLYYKDPFPKLMTKNGYFAAIQLYNDDGSLNETIHPITKATRTSFTIPDKLQLINFYDDRSSTDYIKIWFQIENLQSTKQFRYRLGVYCDLGQASLSDALKGSAVYAKGNGVQHMVVVKGTEYPDVNTFYYGEHNSDNLENTKYPYFSTDASKATSSQNSAYAFSWDRQIKASDPDKIGFYVASTKTINKRPVCKDAEPEKTIYSNIKPAVKFEVSDSDEDDSITLYVKIDEIDTKHKPVEILHTVDRHSAVFAREFKFPDGVYVMHVQAYAQDNGGLTSEPVYKTIYREGANPPSINFVEYPRDSYTIGDQIEFVVDVDDEKQVFIWFQYDQGIEQKIESSWDTTAAGAQRYRISIPIPIVELGNHILYIWVKDDLGISTQKHNFPFTLKAQPNPKINNAYTSDERVLPGNRTVLYGEVTDPDDGQLINITARWADRNAQPVTIGSVRVKNNFATFSKFFDIPKDAKPGRYTIYIGAIDEDNKVSTELFQIGITIYDPIPPPPEKLNKIFEASQQINPDACFSLHFQKYGESTSRSLTYHDEGFYVAYRFRESIFSAKAGEVYYINQTHESTTDDVTIRYYKDTDPISGFFQVKFDISNKGHWSKTMDLGIFADSNFGNQNQRIEMRPDGLGFIVSDPDLNIQYSVFTSYGQEDKSIFPPKVNLSPNITRPASDRIPKENMSFFTSSKIPFSVDADPMYSLYWDAFNIPAKEKKTLILTFAGHDNLRVPSRIDSRVRPNEAYQEANTLANITFTVRDDNIGEVLNWTFMMDGQEPQKGSFTIGDKPETLTFTNLDIGKGPYCRYNLTVVDQSVFYPAILKDEFKIGKQPHLDFDKSRIVGDYIVGERLEIGGYVTGAGAVKIYATFYDGKQTSQLFFLGEVFSGGYENKIREGYGAKIPNWLPPREKPYSCLISIVDENGFPGDLLSYLTSEFSFKLVPNDPPVIKKAGLNKKFAHKGEKLLAYAVINDTQVKRNVFVFMQIGNTPEKKVHTAFNELGRFDKPIAFYWNVPNDESLTPGVYDVTFRVKDFKLFSETNITKTLIINDN